MPNDRPAFSALLDSSVKMIIISDRLWRIQARECPSRQTAAKSQATKVKGKEGLRSPRIIRRAAYVTLRLYRISKMASTEEQIAEYYKQKPNFVDLWQKYPPSSITTAKQTTTATNTTSSNNTMPVHPKEEEASGSKSPRHALSLTLTDL